MARNDEKAVDAGADLPATRKRVVAHFTPRPDPLGSECQEWEGEQTALGVVRIVSEISGSVTTGCNAGWSSAKR